jgi:hypothetical protein
MTLAKLRWLPAFAAAVLLAACAGSPPARYYTLAAPALAGQVKDSGLSVALGPISLPESLDREQFILHTGNNRAEVVDQHRWLQPLRGELARALAADLGSALGTSRVTVPGQSQPTLPDVRVAVDFLRFESRPGSESVIEARWRLRRNGEAPGAEGHSLAREKASGNDFESLVAAHDRALARIAADIAASILAAQGVAGRR